MEFKINSSDLLKALSHIHGIVEVRHTLPILSNIILKANGNELTLSSTNLDIYCADKIKSEVSTAGEISVSAMTFFEIVKRLPPGSDVVMTMEEVIDLVSPDVCTKESDKELDTDKKCPSLLSYNLFPCQKYRNSDAMQRNKKSAYNTRRRLFSTK